MHTGLYFDFLEKKCFSETPFWAYLILFPNCMPTTSLQTMLGKRRCMATTSVKTGEVKPVVGPGNESSQAVEILSNCPYAITDLAIWSVCGKNASRNSSLYSVTTCLLLPDEGSTTKGYGGGGRRRCEWTTRIFYKSCFCWSVPVWFWSPKTCFRIEKSLIFLDFAQKNWIFMVWNSRSKR